MILLIKYNLLLFPLLIFSVMMVMISNSLYMIWMFMELNLMMFLTFLIMNNKFVSLVSVKYYLMSSLSSVVFLYFISLQLISMLEIYKIILNLCMLMKLGVIPFHFWFVDMMLNLNWYFCFILTTIQKIIPFLILKNLYSSEFLFFMCFFSGILVCLMNFNQFLLKKIMTYSSINHMLWMIMSLLFKFNLLFIYFLNYMLINMGIFFLFNKFNLISISDLYMLMIKHKLVYSYYVIMMMLSLGGIPPFYGFLLKWSMIINMVNWMMILVVLLLIIYSLIFLYFYLRILYNNMMLMFYSLKFEFKLIMFNKMNLSMFYMLNFLCSMNLMMFFFWILY